LLPSWPRFPGRPANAGAPVDHYLPLIARIIAQSECRVLNSEAVPAGEKLVSLFEPHADIIVKGVVRSIRAQAQLATGKSGLILDLVIEAGNPARCRALSSHAGSPHRPRWHHRGRLPPMAATPAAPISPPLRPAASPMSLSRSAASPLPSMVKALGVPPAAHLPRRIEANISCFKRVYGAARCTWRGLDHFKAYIWSAVVAHNLVLFARLKLA
jgi:IS5 family transposase